MDSFSRDDFADSNAWDDGQSVEPGIDDEVVIGLAARNRERFAYDSYQRFIDMIWRCGDGSIAFVLRARAGKS